MGKDTAKQFAFTACLRKLRIISNQAARLRTFTRVAAHGKALKEPAIETIHTLMPVDVHVGQEAIKHIFIADEHLSENALGKVMSVFDGEERELDHTLKDPPGRELAVRGLAPPHLPLVKRDIRHYVYFP